MMINVVRWNELGFKIKFVQGQEVWYGEYNGVTGVGHQHSGELLWHERTKQRMIDYVNEWKEEYAKG